MQSLKKPFTSGSVHYWRLDPDLWSNILDRVKEMGFNIICTYVPWGVHEIKRGVFDFANNKNLDAFLELCKEKEIEVIIRPGPNINSELTYCGFPKRIVLDKEIQSKTAEGTPVVFPAPPRMFPVPSYASEKFYKEVEIYLEAVCKIIKRHLYPRGCIIGVQADNEMSFFLRTQPYDHDYSKAAIELYHKFLEDKYKNINILNKIYFANYNSFKDVQPPVEFKAKSKKDLRYYLDWIEYKEYYILYGVNRIADIVKKNGITTPITHNFPGFCLKPPFNLVKMEKVVDLAGFDLYYYKEEYHKVKKGVEYLVGCSSMPFAPEFGCGFFALPLPVKPILLRDIEFTAKSAIMHGLKAINFYMLVERERWVGSPISRFGGKRKKHFEFFKRFNEVLLNIDFSNLQKRSDIILLMNRDYTRLELASSILTPLPIFGKITPEEYVCEIDLGFRDIIQLEHDRQWNALYFAIGAAKYGATLGDTELDLDKLLKYKMVFIVTFDYLSENIQKKLLEYARQGGTLVIGPRAPIYNESGEECNILNKYLENPKATIPNLKYKGIILRKVDIFEVKEPVITVEDKTIAYKKNCGFGTIIHFGFLFPIIKEFNIPIELIYIIDAFAKNVKINKPINCYDPYIDIAIHNHFSNNHEIWFIANPSEDNKILKLNHIFKEVWNNKIIGPKIRIKPYLVYILEKR